MSIKRPRDNEPDDRDVDPDKYLYYIQRHGKECDRIEPQLNGLFVKTKDIESPETPFVKGSNYFFILIKEKIIKDLLLIILEDMIMGI
jgi:hypothetical protein